MNCLFVKILKLHCYFLIAFLFILPIAKTEETHSKTSETENNHTTLSKDAIDKEQDVRKQMMTWSRQMGVTCVYCHNQNNFKSDEKQTYKIAKKHWQMVRLLNEEVFTERDKGGALIIEADCYMCHRGLNIPKYKEPPQNLMK